MERTVVLDGKPYLVSEIMRLVALRPVKPEEEARWKALIRERHYLGLHHLVGETVLHVAEVEGHWVGLVGWCSAALKVSVRDRWIGWNPQQKQRRLKYVAQNGRFLLLSDAGEVPNLASRVLAMSMRRLAEDWRRVHGHAVVLAETFVDGARFPGTCYRAAGWVSVGQTEGYAKHSMQYVEHGQPKQVLVRPPFRGAEGWLREPFDAPVLAEQGSRVDLNRIPIEGKGGLLAALACVPDNRDPHGKRHSLAFILAIAACAVLAGMRGYHQVADFAAALPAEALRRLGARPQESTGKLRPPSEPTIRRTMSRIDVQAFERELGAFQTRIGLSGAAALDGKTLRGSGQDERKPQHLLAAVTHGTPVTLAQVAVGDKTNEIPEALRLLEPLDLRAAVVTADAMHTQTATARFLVEEKGDLCTLVSESGAGYRGAGSGAARPAVAGECAGLLPAPERARRAWRAQESGRPEASRRRPCLGSGVDGGVRGSVRCLRSRGATATTGQACSSERSGAAPVGAGNVWYRTPGGSARRHDQRGGRRTACGALAGERPGAVA